MKHGPSPTRDPRRQCIGKVRHKNERAARVASHKHGSWAVSAYPCPHCGGWHVGHASGANLKRMFQR